jgi:hypothetical protein
MRRRSLLDAQALSRRLGTAQEEVRRESDRAAVILAAAEIDQALRELLEAFVLPPSATSKKYGFTLLSPDGAAGTLSARIELAFRLGLIPNWCQYEAHVIRKIRNEFAHRTGGYSFAQSPARDLIAQLKIPPLIRAGSKKGDFPRGFWKKPKNSFGVAAMCVVAEVICGHSNLIDHKSWRIKPCKRPVRFPMSGAILE